AVVCREEHGSVLSLLREREELLTECLRRLILGTVVIMPLQAMQHGEKLMRIVQRVTELPRTGGGLSHFTSGIAFRGTQRCTQGDKHIHVALGTLRRLGERREQLQPSTEMGNSFHIG